MRLRRRCSHSYLAMTKESPYADQPEQPLAPRAGSRIRRYLIVYPMWKKPRELVPPVPPRSGWRIMRRPHRDVARRYTGIEIEHRLLATGSTTRSSSSSFDADDPAEFLDLVQELRSTESSAYTASETPIFTCLSLPVATALDALDGERPSASTST